MPDDTHPGFPPPSAGEERLCQRFGALADRAGDIAHDLNNTLGIMIGYGALVLEDLPRDDPHYAFLAKVVEAGGEAKRLVADLLSHAREEAGRLGGTERPRAIPR